MFCNICVSTFGEHRFGYAECRAAVCDLDLLHHETLSSLKASAEAGCYACIQAWDALRGL